MDPGNPPTQELDLLEWIFKGVRPTTKLEKPDISWPRRILNFIINLVASFCKAVFLIIACAFSIGNIVQSFCFGWFLFKQLQNLGVSSGFSPNDRGASVWNVFSLVLSAFAAVLSYIVLPLLVCAVMWLYFKLEEAYKASRKAVSCRCDLDRSCARCETKLAKEAEADTRKNADCEVTVHEEPPAYGDCLEKEEEALPDYTAVMEAVADITEKEEEALPDYTAVMEAVADITEKEEEALPDYTAVMAAIV